MVLSSQTHRAVISSLWLCLLPGSVALFFAYLFLPERHCYGEQKVLKVLRWEESSLLLLFFFFDLDQPSTRGWDFCVTKVRKTHSLCLFSICLIPLLRKRLQNPYWHELRGRERGKIHGGEKKKEAQSRDWYLRILSWSQQSSSLWVSSKLWELKIKVHVRNLELCLVHGQWVLNRC